MEQTLKVLSQAISVSNTLIDAYTVSATAATISSLTLCNTDGYMPAIVNIAVAVSGAADTLSQYIYSQLLIGPTDTFIATVGITLATTDVIRMYSTNSLVALSLFGMEMN